MKQFFKMMFASTLGFILASIIVSAILFVTMIGMVAGLSKSSAAAVGPKAGESVFKITLAGEIPETTPENPFSALVTTTRCPCTTSWLLYATPKNRRP